MRLETDRLIIRLATLGDAHFFLKLLNQAAYIQNIRDSNVRTLDDARKFIEDFYFKSYKVNGFGLYILQVKNTSELAGVCGLVKRETLDFPDIGFALLEGFEGKGYIHESATRILQYALEDLKLSELGGITLRSNERSVKVLKKIGLSYQKEIQLPNGDKLDLYTIRLKAKS